MSEGHLKAILPLAPRDALVKLGKDVREARLRRRIPTAIMAKMASLSRTTLYKIEKGDPGVAIGHYALVLFVLGLDDRLLTLAVPEQAQLVNTGPRQQLPKRIRLRKQSISARKSADKSQ